MPVDYANGQIYAIYSPNMENFYIGSCASTLAKRLYQHKHKSNACSSKIVIAAGDAYIELIENFPCKSKKELNKREGFYIRWNRGDVVNCKIEGRNMAEYYQDRRTELLAYQIKYNEEHKEQKAAYNALYNAAQRAKKITPPPPQEEEEPPAYAS